jgi:hypothetical protein
MQQTLAVVVVDVNATFFVLVFNFFKVIKKRFKVFVSRELRAEVKKKLEPLNSH